MPKVDLGGVSLPERAPVTPPSFTLSPEQEVIVEAVQDRDGPNMTIIAVAGSGKTSTLVELSKHIHGGASFAAFNRKIADEIQRKLYEAGVSAQSVKANTFHAFGLGAWKRRNPNVQVEAKKSEAAMQYLGVPRHLRPFTNALASIAKQQGYGLAHRPPYTDHDAMMELVDHHNLDDKLSLDEDVADPIEKQLADGVGWAAQLIDEHMRTAERMIDFDDMLYAPLAFNAPFSKQPWVLIDEAQDTNYMRREMARRMLQSGGRLIAVGDPHQAIYGFTGASHDALDRLADDFGCEDYPLSVSFRCAQSVVRAAQQYVSHIQAASTAPEGSVTRIDEAAFHKLRPAPTDAILCRNTKPLVQLAFGYLRRGIGCHVEGREIGQGLLALAGRWKSLDTVSQLYEKLELYKTLEIEKLISAGKEEQAAGVRDRVETLQVIIDHLGADQPIYRLREVITEMFQDTAGKPAQTITLSTVHKAKGREWERVYVYGRNRYMPSPFARQPWQMQQERNLIYVAITRAKLHLIDVIVADPRNPSGL